MCGRLLESLFFFLFSTARPAFPSKGWCWLVLLSPSPMVPMHYRTYSCAVFCVGSQQLMRTITTSVGGEVGVMVAAGGVGGGRVMGVGGQIKCAGALIG